MPSRGHAVKPLWSKCHCSSTTSNQFELSVSSCLGYNRSRFWVPGASIQWTGHRSYELPKEDPTGEGGVRNHPSTGLHGMGWFSPRKDGMLIGRDRDRMLDSHKQVNKCLQMTAESAKNNDRVIFRNKSLEYSTWGKKSELCSESCSQQPSKEIPSAVLTSGLSLNCMQSRKAERNLTHTHMQGIKVSACAFEPPTRCFFIEPRSKGVSCSISKPWVLRSEPWMDSVRSGSHPPSRLASCPCLSQASSRRLSFLDFCAFHVSEGAGQNS